MSTTPTLEAPLTMAAQQAYTAHSGNGSVGPVFRVLAVIITLGALAVMVGRLCSGRSIMGHGQYGFESWVESKCASCVDGRVDPLPPRVVDPSPEAILAMDHEETTSTEREEEEEEIDQHHPHERADS